MLQLLAISSRLSPPRTAKLWLCLCLGGWFSATLNQSLLGGEPVSLTSKRGAGDIARVEVQVEASGELKVNDNGKLRPLKMTVRGKAVYDEQIVGIEPGERLERTSLRYYETAEAEIGIEKGISKPKLREDRRMISAQVNSNDAALFSPLGSLTREELELIDIPGNSLLVDDLLPEKPVAVGDKWQHTDQLLARLMGLDAVSQSDVFSELKQIDDQTAKVELSGSIQGALAGVAADIDVKGRYLFDRRQNRVTWVALVTHEKRSAGYVAPGVDVDARVQMKITPGVTAGKLTENGISELSLQQQPHSLDLEYVSSSGRLQLRCDRRWFVMNDQPDAVALRLVDRGELVAQCNVSALADAAPDKPTTLTKFQEDIKKTLDKNFGQFLNASQSTSESGINIYRVVIAGTVSELPIQWNYYLVSDREGHQTVFAFTVEQALVEKLGNADQEIVDSLEFGGRSKP
jgi:hypothetical protein